MNTFFIWYQNICINDVMSGYSYFLSVVVLFGE
jgi:hypothetical protein